MLKVQICRIVTSNFQVSIERLNLATWKESEMPEQFEQLAEPEEEFDEYDDEFEEYKGNLFDDDDEGVGSEGEGKEGPFTHSHTIPITLNRSQSHTLSRPHFLITNLQTLSFSERYSKFFFLL